MKCLSFNRNSSAYKLQIHQHQYLVLAIFMSLPGPAGAPIHEYTHTHMYVIQNNQYPSRGVIKIIDMDLNVQSSVYCFVMMHQWSLLVDVLHDISLLVMLHKNM